MPEASQARTRVAEPGEPDPDEVRAPLRPPGPDRVDDRDLASRTRWSSLASALRPRASAGFGLGPGLGPLDRRGEDRPAGAAPRPRGPGRPRGRSRPTAAAGVRGRAGGPGPGSAGPRRCRTARRRRRSAWGRRGGSGPAWSVLVARASDRVDRPSYRAPSGSPAELVAADNSGRGRRRTRPAGRARRPGPATPEGLHPSAPTTSGRPSASGPAGGPGRAAPGFPGAGRSTTSPVAGDGPAGQRRARRTGRHRRAGRPGGRAGPGRSRGRPRASSARPGRTRRRAGSPGPGGRPAGPGPRRSSRRGPGRRRGSPAGRARAGRARPSPCQSATAGRTRGGRISGAPSQRSGDRRANRGWSADAVVAEEEDLAPGAADEQVGPAVAGPVGQGRAGVAQPRGGRPAEPAVGAGVEPEPGAAGLDRLGQGVAVLGPLGPCPWPSRDARGRRRRPGRARRRRRGRRPRRPSGRPARAGRAPGAARPGPRPRRARSPGSRRPGRRPSPQTSSPAVAVEVGGDQAGPVLGQDQRGPGVLEGPGLHQDRRALAAEVPVDLDQPPGVGDEQLQVVAAAPGDRQRGRVQGQVEPAGVGVELGLELEPGLPRLARRS